MWILRNGVNIRVDLDIDPSWNTMDIWKARNLFVRFKSIGYSDQDSSTYASACIWKSKWNGTTYSNEIEKTLQNICLKEITVNTLSVL